MSFSFKPEDKSGKEEIPFKRDDSDNKLFPEIQVKDITNIITDDCVAGWDFDGVVYRACSNMENRLIKVVNKEEGIEETLPNITTFKGRGKKVSETSWLGLENVKRKVAGLSEWTPEDFEVIPFQELKMEEDKAIEQVKIQIFQKIKQVKQQYRIPKVKLLLGGGESFRAGLNQCRKYKGSREDTLRPVLLSKIRKWVLDELDSEFADPNEKGQTIEADDVSNMYGVQGYLHYRKTGKFNKIEISTDKDSLQSFKILINPDTHVGEHNPLKGKFKYPQAMLIEATDRSVGDVELVVKGSDKTTSKELKGYGFLYLMYQAILGKDQADHYSALGHLEKGINFGDVKAYEVLKPCKNAKEALQKSLDVVADLLPYGVQYTSHKGEELDVDTLTYLNEYFLTAYMTRSKNDDMDLFKLCEVMKVDTSKVVNNNLLTPPQKVYIGNEDNIIQTEGIIQTILNEKFKGIKSLKKTDISERLDEIKELLENISFESHYEMKQFEKEGITSIKFVSSKPKRSLEEVIKDYNKKHGYENDPEGGFEVFTECLSKGIVSEETTSEHRWYDIRKVIHEVEIDGEHRFFSTFDYHITGDNSATDMDLTLPTIEGVVEVYPVKKEVTIYE